MDVTHVNNRSTAVSYSQFGTTNQYNFDNIVGGKRVYLYPMWSAQNNLMHAQS